MSKKKRIPDKAVARKGVKDRIHQLVRQFPGLEQRVLPRLLGCSIHYAKELVAELEQEGQIEKKPNTSGVVTLYRTGYQRDRNAKVSKLPATRWNDCRSYQVPVATVLRYRDPGVPVPEEFRVDLEPEPTRAG
jgi:hypothetical protein